jgi:hypothetical protein
MKPPFYTVLFLGAVIPWALPRTAHAQNRRWSFGAELGAGTMLHDFDSPTLNLSTPTLSVSPRFAFRVYESLSLQFGANYSRFLRTRRNIALVGATLGVRYDHTFGTATHLRVDGDVGVFVPGMVVRPGFDVGVSVLFDVMPFLSIGPYVRFTHVWDGREGFASPDVAYTPLPDQDTNSIHWWTLGLTFTLHPLPRTPMTASVPELTGRTP